MICDVQIHNHSKLNRITSARKYFFLFRNTYLSVQLTTYLLPIVKKWRWFWSVGLLSVLRMSIHYTLFLFNWVKKIFAVPWNAFANRFLTNAFTRLIPAYLLTRKHDEALLYFLFDCNSRIPMLIWRREGEAWGRKETRNACNVVVVKMQCKIYNYKKICIK